MDFPRATQGLALPFVGQLSKSQPVSSPRLIYFFFIHFVFQETAQKPSSCVLANNDLIEKILAYGRELKRLSVELKQEHGTNPANKRALEVGSFW